jgi:4-hydroxy-tetrahydrodipicolinate synthase
MKHVFKGTFTALITPFTKGGAFDIPAFEKLIAFQIQNGIDGIVVVGTTGESPTLSHEEHVQVVQTAVEIVSGQIKVVAGAGSNSTQEAIYLSQRSESVGADGLLHITPYYNKPTQKGIFLHFSEVAKSVHLPILLYNIESRCGVNIETKTIQKLANIPNICGVKEASGNLQQAQDVIKKVPKDFLVLSGNDDQTQEIIKQGGSGSVSVLANIFPRETKRMVDSLLSGDVKNAEALSKKYKGITEALFVETNPIPVKTILSKMGFCEEAFRLPLCPMSEENKEELFRSYEGTSSL